MTARIVIIGGGQAGGWAAKTLRDEGFSGEICVVAEEQWDFYERPPLSKAALLEAEPARDAGLTVERGIVVDAQGRSSDPAIFAAGDVAQHHQYGLCIQSWAFAQNQAIATAKAMLDPQASGYDEAPWLWSDQYDRNIQILGIPQAGSRTIVRDEPQGALYFSLNADGRLTQLVAFNNARTVKLAKRWMAAGRDLSDVPLADPTFSLMSLR